MDNKDFHKIVIETVETICGDRKNDDAINIANDTLKRYGLEKENINEYRDDVDYRGVFLSIYYIINRVQEATYEYDDDYRDDDGYGIALKYLWSIMSKYNITDEYWISGIKQRQFDEIKKRYNLK